MDNDLTTLITVEELCDLLMIGRNAAYRLLNSGKIKCFRINRVWKIPRSSVNEYIIEQSNFLL
jgi:excisionase family DNA binding protein